MVGWHHQFKGHEFEQTPGDGKGQGSLACCSPWGHRESDTTEHLNNSVNYIYHAIHYITRTYVTAGSLSSLTTFIQSSPVPSVSLVYVLCKCFSAPPSTLR